jgi:hypothetical protein
VRLSGLRAGVLGQPNPSVIRELRRGREPTRHLAAFRGVEYAELFSYDGAGPAVTDDVMRDDQQPMFPFAQPEQNEAYQRPRREREGCPNGESVNPADPCSPIDVRERGTVLERDGDHGRLQDAEFASIAAQRAAQRLVAVHQPLEGSAKCGSVKIALKRDRDRFVVREIRSFAPELDAEPDFFLLGRHRRCVAQFPLCEGIEGFLPRLQHLEAREFGSG